MTPEVDVAVEAPLSEVTTESSCCCGAAAVETGALESVEGFIEDSSSAVPKDGKEVSKVTVLSVEFDPTSVATHIVADAIDVVVSGVALTAVACCCS